MGVVYLPVIIDIPNMLISNTMCNIPFVVVSDEKQ